MSMAKLSIIVPCYNESKNIPELLNRFEKVYQDGLFELVLVDNGSIDDTWQILNNLPKDRYRFVKLVRIDKNIGYGHGIMTGLTYASADVLAWTHADLQSDPEDVMKAYSLFSETKGKRVVRGMRANRRLSEWIFTLGMSLIASVVLGKRLYDINAQPKLFGRDFYALMKYAPRDFSLDLYWLYLVKRTGYRDFTIPVSFGARHHGESKSAPNLKTRIKTIFRTILYIFRLRKVLKSKS